MCFCIGSFYKGDLIYMLYPTFDRPAAVHVSTPNSRFLLFLSVVAAAAACCCCCCNVRVRPNALVCLLQRLGCCVAAENHRWFVSVVVMLIVMSYVYILCALRADCHSYPGISEDLINGWSHGSCVQYAIASDRYVAAGQNLHRH